MLWPSPLRHAVRRLPEPAQLWLKRGNAALWQHDWAAPLKRLRVREQEYLDRTAHDNGSWPDRKRLLLFALQQVPPWLDVEYSLAAALRLRGHHVRGILCDGLLPLCEMSLGGSERPSCGVCAGWLARYEDAFGFAFSRLTHFVSSADRDLAERLIAETPDHELATLVVDGVAVGRLASRELQRYSRGFVFQPEGDPAYRPWLVSAVLLVRLAGRLLDREQPDIVIAGSGRTLPAACLSAIAKRRRIHVVTWDTEPTYSDGLVFSHNDAAPLLPLDDAWKAAAEEPLTRDQAHALHEFLDARARGDTPQRYNPMPVVDRDTIRLGLGLRPGAPLVAAFTNSAWDMAAVDRDVGFGSMFEWLFALIDYAAARPEIDLVVRAHPSETNAAPDLRSRTPVGPEILKRVGRLPDNITLVEGASAVGSYALAEMAQVVMTYASRIGLEVAVRGKRPWLAGDTTYRGRGFTRDLASRLEMIDLLDAGTFDDVLPAAEIELAKRFAYLWFFRYVTRVPLLRPSTRPFALRTFRELAPGGHPVIDNLCEALVTGRPFVDLGVSSKFEVRGSK